ncbi:hypothetical protein BDW68DRAFT_167578 [Aspergillus falconensis]
MTRTRSITIPTLSVSLALGFESRIIRLIRRMHFLSCSSKHSLSPSRTFVIRTIASNSGIPFSELFEAGLWLVTAWLREVALMVADRLVKTVEDMEFGERYLCAASLGKCKLLK